jgi:hypothetical protein
VVTGDRMSLKPSMNLLAEPSTFLTFLHNNSFLISCHAGFFDIYISKTYVTRSAGAIGGLGMAIWPAISSILADDPIDSRTSVSPVLTERTTDCQIWAHSFCRRQPTNILQHLSAGGAIRWHREILRPVIDGGSGSAPSGIGSEILTLAGNCIGKSGTPADFIGEGNRIAHGNFSVFDIFTRHSFEILAIVDRHLGIPDIINI